MSNESKARGKVHRQVIETAKMDENLTSISSGTDGVWVGVEIIVPWSLTPTIDTCPIIGVEYEIEVSQFKLHCIVYTVYLG